MKKEIYLVLDNIRSRENVGSIFRTADAAGVSKIYLCGITPAPQQPTTNNQLPTTDKISKTALGAEQWVPWKYYSQTYRCLLKLKSNLPAGEEKFKILGLEQTKNSENIFSARDRSAFGGKYKDKKIALVVGNEVRGLSPAILRYCDDVVHIPMYGKKESLNVAVVAGIAVYTILNI